MHTYSTDGMMDKDEFIACFDQIHAASFINSQLTASLEDSTLWREYEHAFNVLTRQITVVNRSCQV